MLQDIDRSKLIEVNETVRIGVLPKGMSSGKPSIGIGIKLPDGRTILVQTSLRLFHAAAKVFAAKYGWQDDDLEGQERHGT